MRRACFLTLYTAVFFGCTKSLNSNAPPVNPKGQVTSVTVTQTANDFIGKDTFRYDVNNNLISYTSISISIASSATPDIDSGTFYFTVDPLTNLPSGYILDFRKYFYTEDYVQKHILYYDNQQRVSKDSVTEVLAGPAEFKTVGNYTYSGNSITLETAYNGTTDITLLDSLLTQDGNISGRSEYGVSGGVPSLSYRYYVFTNTGVTNPFYNQRISTNLGAFYTLIGVGDYLSKNLTQFFQEQITWTTDANGRVLSGIGAAGTTVVFTYQ
jgi:hypothetical protein